ncbi:unnamed protein product [Pseudo-nitzschia multistriata]|uniref:Uncharacterized protein n=1 Tax=Pseudo-nitzschia multistriata TaxID=183589 RepID=A0A448ZRD1_9STRA|nr:unnamed protein product [Pseudo-nitzschia multistriata]
MVQQQEKAVPLKTMNRMPSAASSSSSSSLSSSSSSSSPKSITDDNSNNNCSDTKRSSSNYYLTEEAKKNLKAYTYRGADNSLIYQYVLSPLAGYLVTTIIPKSMAPNTVTSLGLAWMVSAYLSHWWFAPDLVFEGCESDSRDPSCDPPRWIFLWNAISLLVYQTLDNMDGKQARRTGSSSPLGLLFDHGCDSINSIFGSANVIIAMGLVPSESLLSIFLLIFVPMVVFFIATWEQYFTGELIMPIVNGPTEGLLGTAAVSFLSFWFGIGVWEETHAYDLLSAATGFGGGQDSTPWKNSEFLVGAISVLSVQEILLKLAFGLQKRTAAALVPFFAMAASFFVIGWIGPEIWLSIPRTGMHLSMLLFVEICTELMLAHVTEGSFRPWRWQIAPLVGIAAWVGLSGSAGGNHGWVAPALVAYTWCLGAYLVTKCTLVIREICDALEIWCFDIVTPHCRRL